MSNHAISYILVKEDKIRVFVREQVKGYQSTVDLTFEQASRLCQWLNDEGNIQDILPDLSDGERELLMTGIDNSHWNKIFGEN